MGSSRTVVALAVSCLLAACADPLVKYKPITGADPDGWTKFRFAESVIKFDYGKLTSGITNTDVILFSSVPIPYGEKRYGIAGTGFWQNLGVVTTLNVAYRADSDLIQQITVVVTDQRQQAIQALAGIVGAVGGLLSMPGVQKKEITLPSGISVTNLLADLPAECKSAGGRAERNKAIQCANLGLDGTKDFTADISISAVPVDAINASLMEAPFHSANFYYSACRSLTITLKPTDGSMRPISATVSVADPQYLQTLRFPQKGTITVAASCGANSLYQDPGLPTALDYLNTLATQAKAVKEALGKKSGTTTVPKK